MPFGAFFAIALRFLSQKNAFLCIKSQRRNDFISSRSEWIENLRHCEAKRLVLFLLDHPSEIFLSPWFMQIDTHHF